ncbi:MAG: metabolite traffic protein EboE [Hyphomicrobiaceae bacterium]
MRLDQSGALGQLTYCTNIHAGEAWPDVIASLKQHVPDIKAAVAPDTTFGIGLRIGGSACQALQRDEFVAELREFLSATDCNVVTFNGFPYGAFHGQKVKEEVYSPDWSEAVRLNYTNALADTMSAILPENEIGSISTVPGTFKAWAKGREDAIAANLIAHIAHLIEIKRQTGKHIALALEPEPCCMLETIAEAVEFFENRLFNNEAQSLLIAQTDLAKGDAAQALRDHIGLCYDVCHAAVEYEDPKRSIAALQDSGIQISKLQLSSALRISRIDEDQLAELRNFDEPVYLHQVIQNKAGQLTRFTDLQSAFAQSELASGAEWRVHFHVPVFLERMEKFGTTQFFLKEILALHRSNPISPHLEVETYTWDVLPPQYRNVSVSAAIAREIAWVKDQLLA